MNLILSGRGVDLDDSLRGYATDKLTRVERFFDRIIKMEVELTRKRNRNGMEHRVDVTVRTPRETMRAHGEGVDHFAAIDKAADRLETQMRRLKDRLRRHSHRDPAHVPAPPADTPEDFVDIIRRPMQIAKPLTPEEASMELETRGLAFMLFTNAESMQPAVIYRRASGFGLIEG